ncbi:MAG: hydroxymethylglutaryl-CoA lyase [Gammaproteobacteria bacterium]|nr:hydroxymethylglutaryl-CoA lyase [Gammaproteobacteria bacterium]MCH9744628.1 hydroxymethylglutaryl-CoA lyase [Gammaproteobacteria bacterium]
MNLPKQVNIVEVGPRDGLQNEPQNIPTDIKIAFINALSQTGLKEIEATSFVSPKWVPQMADHKEIFELIEAKPTVNYSALVPNEQGLQAAIESGVKHVAVFTAASETFSQKNTNCSISESLKRIEKICTIAKQHDIKVRGYISCVIGCPYEGDIESNVVADIAKQLCQMGCYEISLGDTIGVGTANAVKNLIEHVCKSTDIKKLAVHMHDTYGQALTNIYASLTMGISTIDSAAAGLGGCPYAPGAGGNVATEDVLYLLNGLKIETGIDIHKVIAASDIILNHLKIPTRSKAAQAIK